MPRRVAGGTAIIIAVITMAAGTAATMAGTTVITITAIGIAKAISDDARNRRSLGRPCRLCGRRSGSIARCFTFDLPKRSTGSTALPQRYRRLVEPSDRHLFRLGRLSVQGQAAPAVWNAVLWA